MIPDRSKYDIKPDVLSRDDIMSVAPFLSKHPKMVDCLMKLFAIDKVNWLHRNNCYKADGAAVTGGMLKDLNITLRIDNEQQLENLPKGAFITVSNHPFGAIEGITIVYLIARYRPEFKVLVNYILNKITGMAPNFIAVDALASDDPKKKAISMKGLKEAIMQVKRGDALGMFPAGAVSKINQHLRLEDRQWQESVVRLIQKCDVPVLPVFFHGSNSWWFNLLGKISWQLRTLRLPAEVFNKRNKTMHISVGNMISVEEQKLHQGSIDEFGQWLKAQTYALRDNPLNPA